MIEAGVPCVPGYEGDRQDIEYLATQAEQIGFQLWSKLLLVVVGVVCVWYSKLRFV
jgi:hypothetical protein